MVLFPMTLNDPNYPQKTKVHCTSTVFRSAAGFITARMVFHSVSAKVLCFQAVLFVHPVWYCYHNISWTAWTSGSALRLGR